MARFVANGFGWIPDLPDPRDYSLQTEVIANAVGSLLQNRPEKTEESVDLRNGSDGEELFSEVENQLATNSSTAFAAASLVEYFERRINGRTFNGSKLFLYRNARKLRGIKVADTGADLRSSLQAIHRFGMPDEAHWPFDQANVNKEPSAFAYNIARSFSHLHYVRIGNASTAGGFEVSAKARWRELIKFLSSGVPFVFGFSVPSSLTRNPDIPFRPGYDDYIGGQAVLCVGYELNRYGAGRHALRIRSSWGSEWGDNGYGYIPKPYLDYQLARDFWTLVSPNWKASQDFN